jgi:hypothetical protein
VVVATLITALLIAVKPEAQISSDVARHDHETNVGATRS